MVRVRREDGNGLRDLLLDLTLVAATVNGANGEISIGTDTRSNAPIAVTVTGGDYNGQTRELHASGSQRPRRARLQPYRTVDLAHHRRRYGHATGQRRHCDPHRWPLGLSDRSDGPHDHGPVARPGRGNLGPDRCDLYRRRDRNHVRVLPRKRRHQHGGTARRSRSMLGEGASKRRLSPAMSRGTAGLVAAGRAARIQRSISAPPTRTGASTSSCWTTTAPAMSAA